MPTTRILIYGATGRMGQALLRLTKTHPALHVVAAVARDASRIIDAPAFSTSQLSQVPEFDAAIDFSLPEAFDSILNLCVSRKAALVSGTTGLSDAQRNAMQNAAQHIPVVWSANYSLGVAVLKHLSAEAAKVLGHWSADIFEAHHVHKQDAPSGTALALGESVKAYYQGDVHYQSQRAGDIVGEHTVQFAGSGERIELTHRATNRDIFAAGALNAAERISAKPPGFNRFETLIFS
jgi:4-hydroxy-tetrahydrodipicolinate reductase